MERCACDETVSCFAHYVSREIKAEMHHSAVSDVSLFRECQGFYGPSVKCRSLWWGYPLSE